MESCTMSLKQDDISVNVEFYTTVGAAGSSYIGEFSARLETTGLYLLYTAGYHARQESIVDNRSVRVQLRNTWY